MVEDSDMVEERGISAPDALDNMLEKDKSYEAALNEWEVTAQLFQIFFLLLRTLRLID